MENNFYLLVGKRIRTARNRAELTQEEVAVKLNISPASLGTYERGDRQISLESLVLLSKILDKPLNYFLGIPNEYTSDEIDLLKLYRQADDKTRKTAKIVLGL